MEMVSMLPQVSSSSSSRVCFQNGAKLLPRRGDWVKFSVRRYLPFLLNDSAHRPECRPNVSPMSLAHQICELHIQL